jgi:hypothetical protein
MMTYHVDYEEWITYVQRRGWIGPIVCATHDGIPMSEAEEQEFEDGGDPCQWIYRKYDGEEHKLAVEDNHAPSRWRQF